MERNADVTVVVTPPGEVVEALIVTVADPTAMQATSTSYALSTES